MEMVNNTMFFGWSVTATVHLCSDAVLVIVLIPRIRKALRPQSLSHYHYSPSTSARTVPHSTDTAHVTD